MHICGMCVYDSVSTAKELMYFGYELDTLTICEPRIGIQTTNSFVENNSILFIFATKNLSC